MSGRGEKIITYLPLQFNFAKILTFYMHFHSVSKLHVYDVKLKGKMESICQCITLLHVLHLKSDTLTEILQSHYTHFTLKSLQCNQLQNYFVLGNFRN